MPSSKPTSPKFNIGDLVLFEIPQTFDHVQGEIKKIHAVPQILNLIGAGPAIKYKYDITYTRKDGAVRTAQSMDEVMLGLIDTAENAAK